jgi:hypothetical protein
MYFRNLALIQYRPISAGFIFSQNIEWKFADVLFSFEINSNTKTGKYPLWDAFNRYRQF